MAESKKALVERLFAGQRNALQAFFYRRLRTKADAADLAQEVYLRFLRVNDPDTIRNPEAYLFAVAGNLLKENAILDRRQATNVDIEEADGLQLMTVLSDFDSPLDVSRRVERLRVVLKQLTPKCRAAVVLRYRHELSYEEIADRLEVSTHMVKKYLVQALSHCRRRMARMG
jgi:RNA polymerase sigma-70 factor (ECF subfamily)